MRTRSPSRCSRPGSEMPWSKRTARSSARRNSVLGPGSNARDHMHPVEVQNGPRLGLRENTGNSVTQWISALKQGDQAAASGLWDSYFRRLVGLARARLRDVPRLVADEEDVALSAFDSFCRRAQAGQFRSLHDRDDLWQILA